MYVYNLISHKHKQPDPEQLSVRYTNLSSASTVTSIILDVFYFSKSEMSSDFEKELNCDLDLPYIISCPANDYGRNSFVLNNMFCKLKQQLLAIKKRFVISATGSQYSNLVVKFRGRI